MNTDVLVHNQISTVGRVETADLLKNMRLEKLIHKFFEANLPPYLIGLCYLIKPVVKVSRGGFPLD